MQAIWIENKKGDIAEITVIDGVATQREGTGVTSQEVCEGLHEQVGGTWQFAYHNRVRHYRVYFQD